MKANAVPLLAIFEKKIRLEVPLFQRQYVWNKSHQWEPLWEDISRKFSEYLDGRKEAPVHFLGAMVLDQKQTPTTHVEKRQVIDGQQRLTTLQIFISAFRDFCREQECAELAKECDSYTLNKGILADREVDKFKVWPTLLDRKQFSDVVESGSRQEVERRNPLTKKKYARYFDPRPRMVEAYLFFHDQIASFFVGTPADPPLVADQPIEFRLDECLQALKNALQVVAIDLDHDDDAQVIFETLNARGEPLLPADLLRNFIFLRAARQNEPQEELYKEFWERFDDQFWRQEVRHGRLFRPRSDLFMQHFLSSRQTIDIPIKHLFVEYKFWIERQRPFSTVRDELATLARQRDDFRRIVEPKKEDLLFPLSTFVDCFDVRTIYPLLLFLLDSRIPDADLKEISVILESYILRRAVCGYTTKGYNRIFLILTRFLKKGCPTPENLRNHLSELEGESSEWPTDETFYVAWLTRHAYQTLNNPKICHILKRLSDVMLGSMSERISIDCTLTVEHIMPQNWIDKWPLSDGARGLSQYELWAAEPGDRCAEATKKRNSALQTIGNLTILTQQLNSSVSNSHWTVKMPELLRSSLLPINQKLHEYEVWDEDAIAHRSKALFSIASKIWPAPGR